MNKQDYTGVGVFIEMLDGQVSDVSLELLGKAVQLAEERGASVTALLLGDGSVKPYTQLAEAGADHVLSVFDKALEFYRTESYTYVLNHLVNTYKPEIVLFGATAIGRDLAPRLSARLRTGLTADCTSLEIDPDTTNLMMTRPAFGGNLMATIVCGDHRPQMATVRPGVMQKVLRPGASAQVVEEAVFLPAGGDRIEILETVKNPPVKMNIREAKVLVSGGRGIGAPEKFEDLESIAALLGGTVSASRAAVDAGWIGKAQQVGQTGQTVRPDVYLACGISGAIQHVAGMEESGLIIAINKNEQAPIFSVADLGIVGDVNTVLPALKSALEQVAAK